MHVVRQHRLCQTDDEPKKWAYMLLFSSSCLFSFEPLAVYLVAAHGLHREK